MINHHVNYVIVILVIRALPTALAACLLTRTNVPFYHLPTMTIPFRTHNSPAGPDMERQAPSPVQQPTPLPRRRGAPIGNQNARKRGLYEPHEDLRSAFLAARDTRGAADEIAILRIRIKVMHYRDAPNSEMLHAMEVLNRLLITHNRPMHPDGDPEYSPESLPGMAAPPQSLKVEPAARQDNS